MSNGKTKAQLEEELNLVSAELSDAVEELKAIKFSTEKEIRNAKDQLRKEAEEADAVRSSKLEEARAAYDDACGKAKVIYANLSGADTALLGVPGIAARDAQMNILKEIFGEL